MSCQSLAAHRKAGEAAARKQESITTEQPGRKASPTSACESVHLGSCSNCSRWQNPLRVPRSAQPHLDKPLLPHFSVDCHVKSTVRMGTVWLLTDSYEQKIGTIMRQAHYLSTQGWAERAITLCFGGSLDHPGDQEPSAKQQYAEPSKQSSNRKCYPSLEQLLRSTETVFA